MSVFRQSPRLTLALPDTTTPRVPGNRYGAHTLTPARTLRDYGAGRVCPICGAILRRTNPDGVCDPCQRRYARTKQETKPKRSPGHERVCALGSCGRKFTAHHSRARYCSDACRCKATRLRARAREEARMAKEERSRTEAREAQILELMADGDWHHSRVCAEAAGVEVDWALKLLSAMVADGRIESGGRGGKGYRLARKTSALELAGRYAEAVDKAPNETITVDWFRPLIGQGGPKESAVIWWFEDASEADRERVLEYLRKRWPR